MTNMRMQKHHREKYVALMINVRWKWEHDGEKYVTYEGTSCYTIDIMRLGFGENAEHGGKGSMITENASACAYMSPYVLT